MESLGGNLPRLVWVYFALSYTGTFILDTMQSCNTCTGTAGRPQSCDSVGRGTEDSVNASSLKDSVYMLLS